MENSGSESESQNYYLSTDLTFTGETFEQPMTYSLPLQYVNSLA